MLHTDPHKAANLDWQLRGKPPSKNRVSQNGNKNNGKPHKPDNIKKEVQFKKDVKPGDDAKINQVTTDDEGMTTEGESEFRNDSDSNSKDPYIGDSEVDNSALTDMDAALDTDYLDDKD